MSENLNVADRRALAAFGPAVRRWKLERDSVALGAALELVDLAVRRGAAQMAQAMCMALSHSGVRVTLPHPAVTPPMPTTRLH